MSTAAVLSCAVTGGMTVPGQSAAIPVTTEEIIDGAVASHEAGAAVVHVHVRDPETGKPSADLDLFESVFEGIRERCEAIIQPTTNMRPRMYQRLVVTLIWVRASRERASPIRPPVM